MLQLGFQSALAFAFDRGRAVTNAIAHACLVSTWNAGWILSHCTSGSSAARAFRMRHTPSRLPRAGAHARAIAARSGTGSGEYECLV